MQELIRKARHRVFVYRNFKVGLKPAYRVVLAAAGVAMLIVAAAGCSKAHHVGAKIACGTSYFHWYKHDGGKGDLLAVKAAGVAFGNASKAVEKDKASKSAVAGAQKAVSKLHSSITALQGNLPPDCATGVNAPLKAGLTSFNAAAAQEGTLVTAAQKGHSAAVQKATKAIEADAKAGKDQFEAAAHAGLTYLES